MKIIDFVFVSGVSDAYKKMKNVGSGAFLIAGGTSTFFLDGKQPKTAIDISRIPNKGIKKNKSVFSIGAGTTINELMNYTTSGWVLNRVAREFVNQQVRNISTIGGNIARVFYWSDFPVVLRVLEGKINLKRDRAKTVEIADAFHNAPAHRRALKDSVIESIEIPALKKGEGFGYSKEKRASAAFSSMTLAAYVRVHKGVIAETRLSVGSVVPFPVRLFAVEEEINGQPADNKIIENISFNKISNLKIVPREGMSEEYCRHLLQIRIKDVFREALKEAVS